MSLTSRERMLNAISCQEVDHTPCCFIQFSALEARCRGQLDMAARLLEWGLDAMVQTPPWLLTVPGDTADLRGLPVRFPPEVSIREWSEPPGRGRRYPILHKEYLTPAGELTVEVRKTDDWPYGSHVPFLDDYIIPRAHKPLVAAPEDLEPLRCLLAPPGLEEIEEFHESTRPLRRLAQERGLLVSGGAGVGGDMAGWLCGLQELIVLAQDRPDFVDELMATIAGWNLRRMEVVLDAGVDLWVRRGWYESCDFWSPALYRRHILPHLKREAELAHGGGAKFGYIMTSRVTPLLDMILEAGVDVLIGLDPLMGGTDLKAVKEKVRGRMCLWGGVNAPLTVEQGRAEAVRQAVREALETLSPGGGFILAPVDDVEDPSERAWDNAQAFIRAWREAISPLQKTVAEV